MGNIEIFLTDWDWNPGTLKMPLQAIALKTIHSLNTRQISSNSYNFRKMVFISYFFARSPSIWILSYLVKILLQEKLRTKSKRFWEERLKQTQRSLFKFKHTPDHIIWRPCIWNGLDTDIDRNNKLINHWFTHFFNFTGYLISVSILVTTF